MRPIQMFAISAACAALVGLIGCERQQASKVAVPPAPAAPSLWRIEAVNEAGASKAVDICADDAVRGAFSRPTPEFKGQSCDRLRGPSQSDGNYAVLCRMDHENYVVSATQKGDPASDFTVEMSVVRQDKIGPTFEQTRHYRRLGACPAGWRVGDSAAPGDKQVINTLAAPAATSAATNGAKAP